jgi:hypothetical protein
LEKTVNDIQKETITVDDLKNLNKSFESNVLNLDQNLIDEISESLLLAHLTFLKVLFEKICEYGCYVFQPLQNKILEPKTFNQLRQVNMNAKENKAKSIEKSLLTKKNSKYQEYEHFYSLYE